MQNQYIAYKVVDEETQFSSSPNVNNRRKSIVTQIIYVRRLYI